MPATIQQILKPTRARGLDTSGNNNHAEIYSGRALEFDGVTDYLDAGINVPISTDKWTLAVWIHINTTPASNADNIISASGTYSSNYLGIDTGRKLTIYDYGNTTWRDANTALNLNTWYRAVYSYDGAGSLTFYVNGVADGTVTLATAGDDDDLYIRYVGMLANSTRFFDGMMSDLQAWDLAWTAADAEYDYLNPEQLALNRGGTSLTNSNLKLWYPMNEGHRGNQSYVLDASNTGVVAELITDGSLDTNLPVDTVGAIWTTRNGSSATGGIATIYTHASNVNSSISNSGNNWSLYQDSVFSNVTGDVYKISFDARITKEDSTSKLQIGNEYAIAWEANQTESGVSDDGPGLTSEFQSFSFIYHQIAARISASNDGLAFGISPPNNRTSEFQVRNISVKAINAKNNAATVFYGDELVTEGDFSNGGAAWTASGNITVAVNGGAFVSTGDADGGFGSCAQAETLIAGRTYKLDFDVTAVTGSPSVHNYSEDLTKSLGTASVTSFTDTFVSDGTGGIDIRTICSNGQAVTIDNISLKEVGTATGWTDADQQLDIPQTALQSYNQLGWSKGEDTTINIGIPTYTPAFGTGSFTLSYSLFTADLSKSRRFMGLNESSGAGRLIHRLNADGSLEIYIDDSDDNILSFVDIISAGNITAGKWYHIVESFDRSSDELICYLNGESQVTLDISSIDANLNFGGTFTPFTYEENIHGSITEIAVFKGVALSSAEAIELYNDGKILDAQTHSQTANLNNYWRNNGLATWTDLKGSDDSTTNNMEETMLITAGADGSRDSQGFLMNRKRATNSLNLPLFGEDDPTVDDNASTNYADVGTVINDDVFSVSCWFKPSHSGETQQLVCNRDSGDEGWVLMSDSSNNIEFKIGDGTDTVTVDTGADITVGTWVHITVTYAGSAGAIKTYINGAATATGTATDVGNMSSISSTMRIGARSFTSPMNGVQGEVDDVLYYDDVLGATELLRNYNAGKRSHR